MGDYLRRNLPCFIVLGIYLACILVADPRGEFPLNDDWSYARSAFAFASGQGIKIDQWSAPSLVGQTIYGGLLAKIFSPHFLVLRISTLFLSCCIVLLLWEILLRAGFRKELASVVILAWVFNPLQFNLAFTYMTEIPLIFFAALALYLYILHLDTGKIHFLILSAAALGYGYLIRQTALFFILALAFSLLFDSRKSVWSRGRQALTVVAGAGVFIGSYYVWVLINGGATAAVQRKFELLQHLKSKQLIGNSYGMAFYLAFMLIPVLIFLITPTLRAMRGFRPGLKIGIPMAWCAVILTGLWWFHSHYLPAEYLPSTSYHARMPFLLNVLYDSGLGPLTLDPAYFGAPPTPVHPRIWYAVTAIVAAGAVIAGMLLTFGLLRLRRLLLFRERKPLVLFAGLSFLCLSVFEIVFSHLQEGGLFDRHVLVICFPFSLLLGMLSGACVPQKEKNHSVASPSGPGTVALIAVAITIAASALFCVAATHDYLEWNRIRWDMGRYLLRSGVDPLAIVGGFEFNAWNNYDAFAARGNIAAVHHWWYDRRDYVISMSPQEAYEIRQTKSYFSWVHLQPVNLYLLRDSRLPR